MKGCWTRWAVVVGLCFSLRRAFKNPPKRHGAEDVGGVAGIMMSMLSWVSMVSEGYSAVAMVLCFGGDHGAR